MIIIVIIAMVIIIISRIIITATTTAIKIIPIIYYANAVPKNKAIFCPIHLKNNGRSINVFSISCFVIMKFNFGYLYIPSYRLKSYVYILEIVLVIFWQTSFFSEMQMSRSLTMNSWMKCTLYWHFWIN